MSDNPDWWRGAVFYQIYPRSFMDSDGNGVGDLLGITSKLDYVASLGVDGVWISPFFKSPMKDFGYDVSDYRDVDPLFGANEDFDMLLRKAHDIGLKIVVDMVLSHTSDKHSWFVESRTSKENSRADWYVWADPKPDGTPPNNWQSVFGGPAWTFDTKRGQYYLHNFLKEQPDLNFHNPEVQEAILDTCRYWLDRGIDGFRLDVVNFYYHDKELRDNPPRDPGTLSTGVQVETPYPYIMQNHIYDKSRPENKYFLARLRTLMNEYPGTMTLGEIGDDDPYRLAAEYTNGQDRLLNTTYNTHLLAGEGRDLTVDTIREPIEIFLGYPGDGWPSWSFSNHDVVRAVTRWGRLKHYETNPCFAKMLMALLCSLRGTAFIYQGEELGMTEADIPFDKMQDPWGKAMWPEWPGRDGCRTPMPWHSEKHNAGFTTSDHTWLPIPDEHVQVAVDVQEHNRDSVLNFKRSFIHWRKQHQDLITGDIKFIDSGNPYLLVFTRGKTICAFNLGNEVGKIENLPAFTPIDDAPHTGNSCAFASHNMLTLPELGIFFGTLKD